jgi:protoheme IX farnesyltransferase
MTTDSVNAALAARALAPAWSQRRLDGVWTLVPALVLLGIAALAALALDGGLAARFYRALPLVSLLGVAAYGGMLLGLGVLWHNGLEPTTEGAVGAFSRAMTGGLLAAVAAVLLLPRAAAHPMAEIGPWIFLSATLLLLLLGVLKAGRFSPSLILRSLTGHGARPFPAVARDYLSMTKPGLNGLVLVTTLVGFVMASADGVDWFHALLLVVGTALVAAGASVLNQVAERRVDALMARTAGRPLPAGRLSPADALSFGVLLAIAGLLILATLLGLGPAALAALTLGAYLFLYTPLKRLNTLSTLAGAVAGALPPLLGWVAAGQGVGTGGVLLFLILFFWQIPHFLAIAWKYREQYGAAGFPMYSVLDPAGRATAWQSLLHAVALVGISLLAVSIGLAGWIYGIGAAALGVLLLAFGGRFLLRPTPATARALFFSTLVYLPLLLALMVFDKTGPAG